MLDTVKKGYASDPPHMRMYVQKTNKYGQPAVDRDGLILYRSLRGTSNLESLHQYLTTTFGHSIAGPKYSDVLLTVVRHHYNWRMSRKNRPEFPQIMHYEGGLIDRINIMYEALFGYTKYRNWETFNESLPISSSFGIVPVDNNYSSLLQENEQDSIILSKSLNYLKARQSSSAPFLPIRGKNERKLAHRKLNKLVVQQKSMSNQTVFDDLCKFWNTNHVSLTNKVYPKLPCHFIRYLKQWRKSQNLRDAAISSGAHRIQAALEYVPESGGMVDFEPVPLNDFTTETEEQTPTEEQAGTEAQPTPQMSVLCSVCAQTTNLPPEPKRKKPKTCKVVIDGVSCPYPLTCEGRSNRANCFLRTGGDPEKKFSVKFRIELKARCAESVGLGGAKAPKNDICVQVCVKVTKNQKMLAKMYVELTKYLKILVK